MINESDMTFLPSEELVRYYQDIGANKEKMRMSTIPVDPGFLDTIDTLKRTELFEKYNLNSNIKTVLLISGANGVGNYQAIVKSIQHSSFAQNYNLQLLVVAGKSKKNYDNIMNLRNMLPVNINLSLFPLIPPHQARDFIKIADLVITKAGGLTTTELSMAAKPAILLDINGGQEKLNCNFFRACGGVEVTSKQSLVGELMDKILLTPGRLREMAQAQNLIFKKTDKSIGIANWLSEKLQKVNTTRTPVLCRSMIKPSRRKK